MSAEASGPPLLELKNVSKYFVAHGEKIDVMRNVSFEEAERALEIVVGLIHGQGVFPLEFPLIPSPSNHPST